MQTQRRRARRLLLPRAFATESGFTRRQAVAGAASFVAANAAQPVRAQSPVFFGLTPVFLDSDIKLLAALESYLAGRLGRPVSLVKRRTYQEITAMLLS